MTGDTYAPEGKLTRAQFAALLARALGLDTTVPAAGFSDVRGTDWFAGAVGAAAEAGIIKGYSDGTFRPGAYVTREEIAVMAVNALKAAGVETVITETEAAGYLDKFSDGTNISSWARTAVAVAARDSIIKGYSTGEYIPANNATRAEAAVMVKKMLGIAQFI